MSSTQTTRTRTRATRPATLRLAAAGALAALALAGCQTGLVEEDTTTPVAEPARTEEPTQEAPVTEEPTEEAAATEEPTEEATTEEPVASDTTETEEPADDTAGDDDEPAAGAEPGEVPAPGTEFEVGDTVTTHVQALEEGDEYYGYATLATTVTSVEEGDPELFEGAENAADFAGLTPWYVHVEHEWLTYEGEPNSNMIPSLIAFNESGGELGAVINSTWSGGIPGCELDMPAEKGVGGKTTNCHVFAVPDGEAIGAVGWTGDDWADGGGSAMDNPYWEDPVLWVVP